ncbi:glycosyltransferase family 2 protein [Psychroserpens sp. NJDZ02]|uniref:glycosyltransferase family 2 protein n=1 Tax=Psychroserpens sp. NJDZ02 TaxID=2570561 RepID=UPI0010A8B958|nr:glycosyltransferase family 2 protein [Psychroserpens sp. NJDZ02]QCE40100.1 glycosyltransferase [Psychroserpens sp. NJDZ02]
MNFSLLICTYMRPKAIIQLLESVNKQTLYPNDIIIIDGSTNRDTEIILKDKAFKNLSYYKVEADNRGLTKQRNFGITHVGNTIDVVCFLDDDVVLEPHYFEQLLSTYKAHPEALAVGGYITNEIDWQKQTTENDTNYFYYDGWQRKEPLRFKIRRLFGVLPDVPPGFMPTFSNGRSVSFLPPSGKVYPVEQIMGGVSSYKKEVFDTLNFSTYFEGYGLYEDADFSLRIAKQGMLYINTAAQLAHHHEPSGRPNKFSYGKMVIRNGWYVWRVKYSNPKFKARFKWHVIAILLTKVRLLNVITTANKKEAFTESLGRIVGWFSLFFNPPKHN